MRRCRVVFSAFLAALPALAASIPAAKPEQTGFSSERLARIHDMVQRHIDAHDISGAVTLVAHNGKLVHLEAHGLADVEAKKPMSKDSLFCRGARPRARSRRAGAVLHRTGDT